MPVVADASVDDGWRFALDRLVRHHADVQVVIDGLDMPVAGLLREITDENSGLVIETAGTSGREVVWAPMHRVVCVTAPIQPYESADVRRRRVEQDTPFLAAVRSLGSDVAQRVRGSSAHPPRAAAREIAVLSGRSVVDVETAVEVLAARGEPPIPDLHGRP